MDRDERGRAVTDAGLTIEVHTDKHGKDHVNVYDCSPEDPKHGAIHVNIDYEKESWDAETHGGDHSDSERSSGGCLLTTACVKKQASDFCDDCHELQVLRWFRDNFVSAKDIAEYYDIAPAIVAAIDCLPNCDEVYSKIYESVVKLCVNAIENKEYKLAYDTYKQCVLHLKQMYLLGRKVS